MTASVPFGIDRALLLRVRGATYQEIGSRLSVSRQRVMCRVVGVDFGAAK